jgi:hypothetical protein
MNETGEDLVYFKMLSRVGLIINGVLDWMIRFIDHFLYAQLGTTGSTALSLFPRFTVHRYILTTVLSVH